MLDEAGSKEDGTNEPSLKTRSLPAWVRSKPRPLSTEDDLNDLYAKVTRPFVMQVHVLLQYSPR